MASHLTNLNTSASLKLHMNTSCVACHHDNQADALNESSTEPQMLYNPAVEAIFIAVCVTIALLCICGNALVLFVVSRSHPIYPKCTYVFLSNLAVADLLVGIFCVIPYMYHQIYFTWELPRMMCRIWKFVELASVTVSMLLLQAIALERFIAITYPLQAKRLFTKCKIRFAQIMAWMIALLYSAPYLVLFDAHVYEHDKVSLSYCYHLVEYYPLIRAYVLMNFGVGYLLPLVMMTILYCKIGMTLRHSHVTHQTMDLRQRCPGDMREADDEPVTGSSTVSAARQETSGTTTETSSASRRGWEANSTTMFVSRVKVWWRKRKMQRSRAATRIVRKGCCSHTRRGSVKKSSPCKEARDNEGDQLASQETSFTVHTASPTRVPRTFSFQVTSQGNSRKSGAGCLEPDLSSQGGENRVSEDRVSTERRSAQGLRRFNSSTPTDPGRACAVPRCRVMTQYSSRRRAIRLLAVVVCAFAVLMLPIHVYRLAQALDTKVIDLGRTPFINIFSNLCMYINSAVNPILYTFVSQSFRRSVREALCSCRSGTTKCIRPRSTPVPDALPNIRSSSS